MNFGSVMFISSWVCGALIPLAPATAADTPGPLNQVAQTTFPLAPTGEVPTIREQLQHLCDTVHIGLETNTLDRVIQSAVADTTAQQALSKEAGEAISRWTAEFRNQLREEATQAADSLVADLKQRAPKTATVAANTTRQRNAGSRYAWTVRGLEGATAISFQTNRPITLTHTLSLNVPGRDTPLELPLKWQGNVLLEAEWKLECADRVTGAITVAKTHVRADRWCHYTIKVEAGCEWPLFADTTESDEPEPFISLTGTSKMKYGTGLGGNFAVDHYRVPLEADTIQTLDSPPLDPRR